MLGEQVDPLVRYEWPFFRGLVRVSRTRKLYLVQRIYHWGLLRAIVSCAYPRILTDMIVSFSKE